MNGVILNLLPDVRQAKLKDRRRRQLVSGVSVLIWAVCGGIVVLMSVYAVGQKAVIAAYTSDIQKKQAQLEGMTELLPALTAAQHLASLPGLYDQRVYLTKFLTVYAASNPSDVRLTTMTLDNQNALLVSGDARSYSAVAKLQRALEQSNVSIGPNASATNTPNFSNVKVSSVSAGQGGVSFSATINLQPGVTSGK